jgi:hypothetical protein
VHYTPTSASWLNQVERFFALLTERALKRGMVRSVRELEQAIEDYLEATNADPKPFVLVRPDENRPQRQAFFELRNGPPIETKILLRRDDGWIEATLNDQRLAMQGQGAKHDAERRRQHDVILQQIYDEAAAGRVYTPTQFAEQFENRGGLGGASTIRGRILVLATKGYIRFFKNAGDYGLDATKRSKFGYLCVEHMILGGCDEVCDPKSGEITTERRVVPTHYKFPQTGEILPVEDPENWTYDDAAEGRGV